MSGVRRVPHARTAEGVHPTDTPRRVKIPARDHASGDHASMTTHADITDPLTLAETCLEAAHDKALTAAQLRAEDKHSAAGIERENQRYYLARSRALAEISKARSLASIADDLAALRLNQ